LAYLGIRHLLADGHSKKGQLEEVDLVCKSRDEVLIQLSQKAVDLERGIVDHALQLQSQLMPQLSMVELPQLRNLGSELWPPIRSALYPLHIFVHVFLDVIRI
jgi:hypothetical protein